VRLVHCSVGDSRQILVEYCIRTGTADLATRLVPAFHRNCSVRAHNREACCTCLLPIPGLITCVRPIFNAPFCKWRDVDTRHSAHCSCCEGDGSTWLLNQLSGQPAVSNEQSATIARAFIQLIQCVLVHFILHNFDKGDLLSYSASFAW
jgi:hypothetical protein